MRYWPTLGIFRDAALLTDCRLEKPLSMQACPVCNGTLARFTPHVHAHSHDHDHVHPRTHLHP